MDTSNTSALATLNEEVSAVIKSSGPVVRQSVIDKFVDEEIKRRSDLLTRLVIAINAFRKQGSKFKPDLVTYDGDGKVTSEGWTKGLLDQKKKFTEKLDKADKAFEKALNDGDYNNVENVIKELSAGDKKDEASDSK
jgi:hypothetical protein